MPDIHALLDALWADYTAITPQAARVHDLLTRRGERIVNDHIALRTFDLPSVNIEVLARPFVDGGYVSRGEYAFEEKHLDAKHYEHHDATLPKVFISQLRTGDFSQALRDVVRGLVGQIPADVLRREDLPVAGRLWQVSYAQYEALRAVSEYAAWVAAFGFRANHFTVSVNALRQIDSLEALNALLKQAGFALSTSGGEIKGSPEVYLEQSSTLADTVEVAFSDRTARIPSCYYEFARRHPLPNGELFQGFVAKSADKIFESTNPQRAKDRGADRSG